MKRYILGRLVQCLVTLLGVSAIVFVVLRLSPGDPAALLLGDGASQQEIRTMRESLGLGRPIPVQFVVFLGGVAQGQFGKSITYREESLSVVLRALPATIELAIAAFVLAVFVAFPIGALAGYRPRSLVDRVSMLVILVSQSLPTYWIGILLIMLFSLQWQLLPTSGRGGLAHLLLPAATLSTFLLAMVTRLVRAGVLEVMREDYVRTARAKGVSEFKVACKHALRNVLIPVTTVLALQLGTLLGGSVMTEAVFAWPGVGYLAMRAIQARDYPLVQAAVLIGAFLFVIVNLGLDIVYGYLDPRARGGRRLGA